MRLSEQEIDHMEALASSVSGSRDADLRIHAEAMLIHHGELLMLAGGMEYAVKFMRSMANAYENHAEHGDLLHSAFQGFRELQRVETV